MLPSLPDSCSTCPATGVTFPRRRAIFETKGTDNPTTTVSICRILLSTETRQYQQSIRHRIFQPRDRCLMSFFACRVSFRRFWITVWRLHLIPTARLRSAVRDRCRPVWLAVRFETRGTTVQTFICSHWLIRQSVRTGRERSTHTFCIVSD